MERIRRDMRRVNLEDVAAGDLVAGVRGLERKKTSLIFVIIQT